MSPFVIILFSLLFSAFFSGMEIAFISANKLRIELDKKKGRIGSNIIALFVNNPGKFLATMLIGNNISLVIYGIVMAMLVEPFIKLNIVESPGMVLFIQTIFSTFIILTTAEFLPKVIFRSVPNVMMNILVFPVFFFYILFYPITLFINWISEIIIRRLRKPDNESSDQGVRHLFNKIDLVNFIGEAGNERESETTQKNDLKLFQNALDFSSLKTRDCMTPRTEIVAVPIDCDIKELRQKFIDTGYSKIVVYDDNIDEVVGYVTSKSLFKNISTINGNLIETDYVPETMAASRLLEQLIQGKKSLAIVVDEFGGVSGLITIEDIIEEIFGEIEDEHDTVELIEKQISDKEFILSGRLEINHVNDKYNLDLPKSEDYDTIAGLIFHHYENIPKLNKLITIGDFEFKILKVSDTKIGLVHLYVL